MNVHFSGVNAYVMPKANAFCEADGLVNALYSETARNALKIETQEMHDGANKPVCLVVVTDEQPDTVTIANYTHAASAQNLGNIRAYTGTQADISKIKTMIEQTPQFTMQA
jgi:hypothetical protein